MSTATQTGDRAGAVPRLPAVASTAEDVLRLVEATNTATGHEFFRSLVRHLAGALGVKYGLVGELRHVPGVGGSGRIRTLAVWGGDGYADNIEYNLAGTPCEHVVAGDICEYPREVTRLFPHDIELQQMGAESYLGVPLYDTSGEPLGILAVLHNQPTDEASGYRSINARGILRIFAGRAAAELQRLRREEELHASQRRYQAVAEAAPVGIYHDDAVGNCVWASPLCAEITGLAHGTWVGMGWVRNIHPDDRERVMSDWNAAAAAGREYRGEYRFQHADGRVVWVLSRALPERDAEGRVAGYIGTITDITSLKEAQERLLASERRYQALVEINPGGIWNVDFDGRTLYMNPAMKRLLELEPGDDLRGETYYQFFTPESLERMQAEHIKRRSGQSTSYEVELIGRRGARRSVFVTGAPVYGPLGSVQAMIATFTDVTERRQDETRFRLLIEQAPAIIWTADASLRATSGMGAGLKPFGLPPNAYDGVPIARLFAPEDADPAAGEPAAVIAHRRALGGDSSEYEQTWLGHTFASHVEPIRSVDGTITGVIGVALDITERIGAEAELRRAHDDLRRAHDELELRVAERTAELLKANDALRREVEERTRAEEGLRTSQEQLRHSISRAESAAGYSRRLAREVEHRVRNNLMGLLGLVSAMKSRARDVGSFAAAIEGRLLAMHHVHCMLAATDFQSVDMSTLVRSLLEAAENLGCEKVNLHVEGPAVALTPQQSLALSVILMEWFVNSCKYGAHSSAGATVRITWRIEERQTVPRRRQYVQLHWHEQGGPPVAAPRAASLGTEIVQGFANNELGGRCELRFPPGGVDHLLEFPLGDPRER